MLANQYMAQIQKMYKGNLGNAGTVTCFALGASDAEIFTKNLQKFSHKTILLIFLNIKLQLK